MCSKGRSLVHCCTQSAQNVALTFSVKEKHEQTFKLFMTITSVELDTFTPVIVALFTLEGDAGSRKMKMKVVFWFKKKKFVSKFKLCVIGTLMEVFTVRIIEVPLLHYFVEIINLFLFPLKTVIHVGLFLDAVHVGALKLHVDDACQHQFAYIS